MTAEERENFVERNSRMASKIAHWYAKNTGQDFDDLRQEGCIGLLRASETYNPKKGSESTYCVWWIRSHITRYIENLGLVVRLPCHISETRRRVYTARWQHYQATGEQPTVEELSLYVNQGITRVQRAMDARDFSPTHQETTEFLDKLRKEEDTNAEIQMITIEKLRRVARIVNEIPNSRTRVIIRRYYGFEGAPETYQEIGDRLGLSRERIRQIIEAELEVLRREIAI